MKFIFTCVECGEFTQSRLEATTEEEAINEALADESNLGYICNPTILVVEREIDISSELTLRRAKVAARNEERRAKAQLARDKKEYERLKALFEPGGGDDSR